MRIPAVLAPELVERWGEQFVNRVQPYALQQGDGTYRWVYAPADRAVLADHLRGVQTIALSSTDAHGLCKWACLDVDQPEALPQLLALGTQLARRGLSGFVEASRRGGHLWLCFATPVPASAARPAVQHALAQIQADGQEVPSLELYPDTARVGALGHAVRLPLGVHQLTGQRYPLFDAEGRPCAFRSLETAMRFVLEGPTVPLNVLHGAGDVLDAPHGVQPSVDRPFTRASLAHGHPDRVGTISPMIRWVDAHVSPLDLLAELAPDAELRRVGRGYLGWCVFHDDRAADATGQPGTPSLYVVQDRRYGWSWRCLSTNCLHHLGPMRHSFRLFQELLGVTCAAALREACAWWPEADPEREADDALACPPGQ